MFTDQKALNKAFSEGRFCSILRQHGWQCSRDFGGVFGRRIMGTVHSRHLHSRISVVSIKVVLKRVNTQPKHSMTLACNLAIARYLARGKVVEASVWRWRVELHSSACHFMRHVFSDQGHAALGLRHGAGITGSKACVVFVFCARRTESGVRKQPDPHVLTKAGVFPTNQMAYNRSTIAQNKHTAARNSKKQGA